MHKMGYLWKKDPKGQYKDGHKCEDVVAYWQNVFLPYVATLHQEIEEELTILDIAWLDK